MTGQNFAMNVHLIVVVKESECSDFKLLVIPLGIKVVFHGCVSRTTVGSESKKYLSYNSRAQVGYFVHCHLSLFLSNSCCH